MLFDRLDLILHQRDQGRHDYGHAGQKLRRELVDKRFTAAGRQHGQDITAREQVLDYALLLRPKLRVSELPAQQSMKVRACVVHTVPM